MTDLSGAAPLQLRLRRHEDRRIRAGHAWVFSNEIDTGATPLAAVPPGAAVAMLDHRGQFLGHALANPHALICARIMSRDAEQPIDRALLAARLRSALALRARYCPGLHHRLVYGESDGLPGLVVDRFGDVLVGQIATLAMEQRRALLEEVLREVVAPRLILWKNDTGARDLEGLPHELRCDGGALPEALEVIEAGLRFAAPLASGQKTGWFYDQTANRALLRRFLQPGQSMLDVCSYVGGWAVSALAAGASTALCVDSSSAALDAAQANAARNGCVIEARRGDAFEVLAALQAEGRRFDVIVVDPPAFVKRRKDLPKGEAAYRKLNQLAMQLASDEALLVSCSCSWHLPAERLPELLQAAASHVGRTLAIIAQGGQSPDHPVHPAMPETRYLKALFARVSR
ncbi:MAG TPA: class I SAM-dependent rRNA methyltransferase [Steroidobacteraceae bacterium]|nr:class I SAM-dependent rRNA methyltransferase [Steroidobacteraceae bacterium]